MQAAMPPTIGPYALLREIGTGGMGQVYLAQHQQIGSRVAIKVLNEECARNREAVERFFAEAKVVNVIAHENIVTVHDFGHLPNGQPYIIMEYLEGQSLAAILAAQPGPTRNVGGMVRVIADVLSGLSAAHAKHIIHRDLKPDNVFITKSGRVKLLDFGIAKLSPDISLARTQTGSMLGTPAYMSPEQTLGRMVDARSDLYAVGVMLFECLAGVRPFVANSLFELLRMHVEAPIPSLVQWQGLVPAALANVVATAMAKRPDERFATADEMIAALQSATAALAPSFWQPVIPAGGTPSVQTASWGAGPTVPDAPKSTGVVRPRAVVWMGALIALAALAVALVFVARSQSALRVDAGPGRATPTAAVATPDASISTPVHADRGSAAAMIQVEAPSAPSGSDSAAAASSVAASSAAASSVASSVATSALNLRELTAQSRARARRFAADTYLVRIDAEALDPRRALSGEAAQLEFKYVSRGARAAAAQLRAGERVACEFIAQYARNGWSERTFVQCEATEIPAPSCSLAQVYERALALGLPASSTVDMSYYQLAAPRPRWFVTASRKDSVIVEDQCQ